MKYIKNLYTKKPTLVRSWVRKMFNVKNQQRLFDIVSLNKDVNENCVLLGLIDLDTRDVAEILLEDFDVCYGDEYLEIDDKRLEYYLIHMAQNCDDKYIQGFHNSRSEERKDLITTFNEDTYNLEAKMAEAINAVENQDGKTL